MTSTIGSTFIRPLNPYWTWTRAHVTVGDRPPRVDSHFLWVLEGSFVPLVDHPSVVDPLRCLTPAVSLPSLPASVTPLLSVLLCPVPVLCSSDLRDSRTSSSRSSEVPSPLSVLLSSCGQSCLCPHPPRGSVESAFLCGVLYVTDTCLDCFL